MAWFDVFGMLFYDKYGVVWYSIVLFVSIWFCRVCFGLLSLVWFGLVWVRLAYTMNFIDLSNLKSTFPVRCGGVGGGNLIK